ncbi:MAG: DPP IV N-terminal domain-containing protein [Ferruginibacter sp.]
MFKYKVYILLVAVIAFHFGTSAQQKPLTDDQYFKGNFKGIVDALPNVKRWTDNSHFLLAKDGKTFIVDATNGTEREATEAETKPAAAPEKPSVYSEENDLFIKINGEKIQLTNDNEKEVNATMSPDGNYVAFTRKNDLYSVNIKTKKETRYTEDGSDVIMNGYSSWVYMEEILGRPSHYRAFWWSPDSKHIAFFRTDDSKVPVYTLTDGGTGQKEYLETTRYPKVGDTNPMVKVGIVSTETRGGIITWAELNPRDDQYLGLPYWKPDGSSLLVQWINRKQNNLKIWDVDLNTGLMKLFYNETQKTWIDLDDEGSRITFLKNGKGFILFSDSSGWKHMYYYDMKGKLINPVTAGKFTVTDLNYIDEEKGIVYFTARKENTARKDLYKINLDGKKMQRLTFGEYNHTGINLAPDASYFITTYSNSSTPAKMTLVSNTGKIIKDIADAKGPEFDNYQLAKTELIRVKSDDGLYELPMKVTWPANMDKAKKYPVLINVYGGPNAGTVMDSYTIGGNQQWFAKDGLIQVAMDHRASGHFGKEGVNYMYHNFGYWEIKDYSTMVKWLIANGNADAEKVCISGFSYGGYITCYALTYAADVFTYGMAGGSVADWSLYDTHYTERYMGTLADNAEGYKNSSPLTYVDKYKGMLQIVHGVIDDNVHMQNSLQLIAKLEDLKKDFEFMLYPGGRHGWPNLPNRALHFQNLKTKFIYRYLLNKEVPKGLLK